MHRSSICPHMACAAVLITVLLVADSSALAQSKDENATKATPENAGLILKESEGELRIRRPRGNIPPEGAPNFLIKVDRTYGGSPTFYMGMENIPPGKKIRLHHHPHTEEILFVHRGTGTVRLGAREATVTTGGTVYIPRGVTVGLRNTGTEPLSLVFIFPEPDGMSVQMRSGSVGEGEKVTPLTPEEIASRGAQGSPHIVFDEPQTP